MLQALIGPVTGLLDKFIPDADEKASLAHVKLQRCQSAMLKSLQKVRLRSTRLKRRTSLCLSQVGDLLLGGLAVLLWLGTLLVSLLLFLSSHLLVWSPSVTCI